MNFFVEGLQGSGKSTLVSRLAARYPGYRAVREGEYSPVELSWCAYLDRAQYDAVLERYPELRGEIIRNSFSEDDRVITCYTLIRSDDPAFYRDLERYEIYNGRVGRDEFRRIILSRFERCSGDRMIFECSLFQNIMEDMMLFQVASDEEILDLYRLIGRALSGRDIHILYLQSDDIGANIAAIRKERTDGQGNEAWFNMMCRFFDESPYAAAHGLSGEEDLLEHFRHRQELELRLCREIFPGKARILRSKGYRSEDL